MNDFNQQKTLFDITYFEKIEESIHAKARLLSESDVYKAHFPNNPITPGVCQLQLIRDCIKTAYQINDLSFVSSKFVKFVSVLRPNEYEEINIKIKLKQDDSNLIVEGQIFMNDTIFLKAKLNYLLSA